MSINFVRIRKNSWKKNYKIKLNKKRKFRSCINICKMHI